MSIRLKLGASVLKRSPWGREGCVHSLPASALGLLREAQAHGGDLLLQASGASPSRSSSETAECLQTHGAPRFSCPSSATALRPLTANTEGQGCPRAPTAPSSLAVGAGHRLCSTSILSCQELCHTVGTGCDKTRSHSPPLPPAPATGRLGIFHSVM